jgi:hypothetical protein
MEILYIIIAIVVIFTLINLYAIWFAKKHFSKDENNNMIPDVIEKKFNDLKDEVSSRMNNVGEELKDVSKAIKEVGNQIGDVPKAFKGKK